MTGILNLHRRQLPAVASSLANLTAKCPSFRFIRPMTSAAANATAEPSNKEVPVPISKFSELTSMHSSLQKSVIRGFKYDTLSLVQKQVLTLNPEHTHKDLFIKSKTGSGKTLAFLIPAIQNALENMTEQELSKGVSVQVLIVSPTRELAKQIGDEAMRLISNAPGLRMGVQVVVGGESRNRNLWDLRQKRVDILVGTPGRLKDLLDEPELKQAIKSLKTVSLLANFSLF